MVALFLMHRETRLRNLAKRESKLKQQFFPDHHELLRHVVNSAFVSEGQRNKIERNKRNNKLLILFFPLILKKKSHLLTVKFRCVVYVS